MSPVRRRGAPRVRRRAIARLSFCFGVERTESGRWESGKPAFGFHFSIRPRRRSCGNVGISPALGEISKELVERVGSLPLAFHAFHSAGISTALSPRFSELVRPPAQRRGRLPKSQFYRWHP